MGGTLTLSVSPGVGEAMDRLSFGIRRHFAGMESIDAVLHGVLKIEL